MFDVITIGSATRDTFYITDKGDVLSDPEDPKRMLIAFEFGTKIYIDDLEITNGGGASNTGTSFLRLGLKTKSVMNVGNDEMGRAVRDNFKKEGGDPSHIQTDKKNSTGLSAIIIDKRSGERTVLFYPGANRSLSFKDITIIDETKWLYVAPLSSEEPYKSLPLVCSRADEKGIQIAYNPSIRQIEKGYESMKDILACTKVLIVNKQEAKELVGSYLGRNDDLSPEEMLTYLREMGPETCLITMSEQGSMVMHKARIHKQSPAPSKPIDTTGAGDCFGSTFVAGMIKGMNVSQSLKMASLNSASVISHYGAQPGLLTIDKLKDLAKIA